jgi:hypothetical protein
MALRTACKSRPALAVSDDKRVGVQPTLLPKQLTLARDTSQRGRRCLSTLVEDLKLPLWETSLDRGVGARGIIQVGETQA